MIQKVYIFHEEKNYFGQTHTVESELYCPYEERILKALDKFSRRLREGEGDILHIITDDRHYVLSKELLDGEWRLCWFYFYGAQNSRSETVACKRADVRRMVKAKYREEELAW